jgi:hypothetical protein
MGNFCCAEKPCFNGANAVGTGTVASPDTAAGTCPTGQSNTLTDSAGNFCCAALPCFGVGSGAEASPNTSTGTCGAGQTNTGTLKDPSGNYCCTQEPCFNGTTQVGTGVEATPDTAAGTCPAGTFNSLTDLAGNFCCSSTLLPCTSASQIGCVQCSESNAGGICTTTEAYFVERDIALGNATAPGPDNGLNSCYECLVGNSCIDSLTLGVHTKECEDGTLVNGTTIAECYDVIQCIMASGPAGATTCATSGVATCYCGTDPAASCNGGTASAPVTAGVNGACDTQMAAGMGFPLGDGADIHVNYSTHGLATGRADQIIVCGGGSCVMQCNF